MGNIVSPFTVVKLGVKCIEIWSLFKRYTVINNKKKSIFVESPLLLRVISQRDTELSAMGDINSNPPFRCLPLSLLML